MSQVLPHSLDIVQERLGAIMLPDGPFDPSAEWEHKYLKWVALHSSRRFPHLSWRISGIAPYECDR